MYGPTTQKIYGKLHITSQKLSSIISFYMQKYHNMKMVKGAYIIMFVRSTCRKLILYR